jgi:hypothetical protein
VSAPTIEVVEDLVYCQFRLIVPGTAGHGQPQTASEHRMGPGCCILFLAGLAAAAGEPPKGPPLNFKITTRRADDSIEVQWEKGQMVLEVKSPFGISEAVVGRTGGAWPQGLGLRLHLKGLSRLRVVSGKVTLDATASVRDGKVDVRLWKDGKEDAPLDARSPLWMDIRVVGGDGKPARELPLKDGYFEMTLPAALFEGNPPSITLSWIDFYRQ